MSPVSGAMLLHIWEYGQGRHSLDQALAILAGAFPERAPATLAALSIGQRDGYLLEVYAQTFGSRLDALVNCPQCQELLELPLRVDDIRITAPPAPPEGIYQHTVGSYTVRLCLPSSVDLASIARYSDVAMARAILLQRCILEATCDGRAVPSTDVPEVVLQALAAYVATCDPQAEVQLNLVCPACAHCWQILFDIVTFFWARLRTQVQTLLRDVHTLAAAYGWHEADILAMSEWRRQCYLDMLT